MIGKFVLGSRKERLCGRLETRLNITGVSTLLVLLKKEKECKTKTSTCVEEHRSLGGSIISRLDNGAFVGLIYKLLVFS